MAGNGYETRWKIIGKPLGQGGQGVVYKVVDTNQVTSTLLILREAEDAIRAIEGKFSEDDRVATNLLLRKSIELLLNRERKTRFGALKVLHDPKDVRDYVTADKRLYREINAMERVKHPHLVEILDSNVDERWYVSRFYSGGSMIDKLDRFKGNAFSGLCAFRELVSGVAEIHKAAMVHRDIKPHNIFMNEEGSLVLGDFGLVIFQDDAHTRISHTMDNVGSRDWMPPWAMGMRIESINPTFDVFSLGKVLWSLLSGQSKLHLWYYDRDPFDLRTLYPHSPFMESVNKLLSQCIVENESHCLPSASQLLVEVDNLIRLITPSRDSNPTDVSATQREPEYISRPSSLAPLAFKTPSQLSNEHADRNTRSKANRTEVHFPIGLELSFCRSFTGKPSYSSITEAEIVQSHCASPYSQQECIKSDATCEDLQFNWQLIEHFALLTIKPLHSLKEIAHSLDRSRNTASFSKNNQLVLIPFEDELKQATQTDFYEFVLDVATPEVPNEVDCELAISDVVRRQKHPLLAGATFSLSGFAHFTGSLHSTEALRRIVLTLINEDRANTRCLPQIIRIFRTLNGQDIVLLALPASTQELLALNQLLLRIRQLNISELREVLERHKPHAFDEPGNAVSTDWERRLQNAPKMAPALASVERILAFRINPGKPFHLPTALDEIDLRITFALRLTSVDSFPFEQIRRVLAMLSLDNITQTSDDIAPDQYLIGKHAIIGTLRTLDHFATLWSEVWKHYEYIALHLLDGHVTVTFGDERNLALSASNNDPHRLSCEPALYLCQHVEQLLDTLTRWAYRYCSRSQKRAFLSCIDTIRGCFLRYDVALALFDLVPFLRQLEYTFSIEFQDLWDEYNKYAPQNLADDLSELVSHLYRALNSRLNDRSGLVKSTVSPAWPSGTSKMFGASSASSWLCIKLLTHQQNNRQAADMHESFDFHFSIAAGDHRLQNQIPLFNDFGRFVRRGQRCGQWTYASQAEKHKMLPSSIILSEISEESLSRPEASLVLCLQETVRYSKWLSSDHTRLLRSRLNQWALLYFRDVLLQMLDRADENEAVRFEMAEFMMYLVPHVLNQEIADYNNAVQLSIVAKTVAILSSSPLDDYPEVSDFFGAVHKMIPSDFAVLVAQAISKYIPRIDSWRGAAAFKRSFSTSNTKEIERLPFETNRMIELLSRSGNRASLESPIFNELAETLITFVTIVSSDIGMWCAFDHVISCDNDSPNMKRERAAVERLRDIHLIFSNVLHLESERSNGPLTSHNAEFVLLRWVIQAVGVSDEVSGCDSIVKWLSHESQQLTTELLLRSDCDFQDVDELSSFIRSIPSRFSAIFGITHENNGWKQPMDCLMTSLKYPSEHGGSSTQLEFYTDQPRRPHQESLGNFGFPSFADQELDERRLWATFQDTWMLVRKKAEYRQPAGDACTEGDLPHALEDAVEPEPVSRWLATSQLKLINELWAQSIRLASEGAFQSPLNDMKPATPATTSE